MEYGLIVLMIAELFTYKKRKLIENINIAAYITFIIIKIINVKKSLGMFFWSSFSVRVGRTFIYYVKPGLGLKKFNIYKGPSQNYFRIRARPNFISICWAGLVRKM